MEDRAVFVTGLIATETTLYAWALLPNHVHLGTVAFVERILAAGDARLQSQRARASRLAEAAVVRAECQRIGVSVEGLQMGEHRRQLSAVRARLAVRWVTQLGLFLAEAARHLGVSTSGLAKPVTRSERE